MKNFAAASQWDDLRILLAVVRSGSFLAAGSALDLAVSTVSRRIAHLESSTESKLIERRSDGAHATPKGRELAALAERMELEIAAALRSGTRSARALEGVLRVSVGDGFTRPMMDCVASFSIRHPGIAFEFIVESRAADLRKREADIAVRTVHKQESSLVYRRIGRLDYGLAASSAYLERAGTPTSIEDLRTHSFVSFAPPLDRHMTVCWLERIGARRYTCLTTSFRSLLAAVRAGIGVGALPRRASNGLIALLPGLAPDPLELFLVTHPEALRRREVRAFADAILADMGRRLSSD